MTVMTPAEKHEYRARQAREIQRDAERIARLARKFQTERASHSTERGRLAEMAALAIGIDTRIRTTRNNTDPD